MDKWLVLKWNQSVGWGGGIDYLIWFAADFGLLALLLLMLIRWFWPGAGRDQERQTVLLACAGAVFALGCSLIATQFYERQRPYMALDGAFNLLGGMHSPSFPSDHGTLVFTLAIIMGYRAPLWAALTWPISLSIAWARVAAGVHYPSDMLGSFGVALGVSTLLLWLRPDLEPALNRLIRVLSPGARPPDHAQPPGHTDRQRTRPDPWTPPPDAWPRPDRERE